MGNHTLSDTKVKKPLSQPLTGFKLITDFYQERISKLVYLLYSKGVHPTEVAKTLGITRSAVLMHYPLKKEAK